MLNPVNWYLTILIGAFILLRTLTYDSLSCIFYNFAAQIFWCSDLVLTYLIGDYFTLALLAGCGVLAFALSDLGNRSNTHYLTGFTWVSFLGVPVPPHCHNGINSNFLVYLSHCIIFLVDWLLSYGIFDNGWN